MKVDVLICDPSDAFGNPILVMTVAALVALAAAVVAVAAAAAVSPSPTWVVRVVLGGPMNRHRSQTTQVDGRGHSDRRWEGTDTCHYFGIDILAFFVRKSL